MTDESAFWCKESGNASSCRHTFPPVGQIGGFQTRENELENRSLTINLRECEGLTQFPAGLGVKDPSELKPDLVDPCENLRIGTEMFARIMRIVAKWYGNPTSKEVFPLVFEDAVYAWNTGQFEGQSVFQAEDPGIGWAMLQAAKGVDSAVEQASDNTADMQEDVDGRQSDDVSPEEQPDETDTGTAGIRIDLSRINGK